MPFAIFLEHLSNDIQGAIRVCSGTNQITNNKGKIMNHDGWFYERSFNNNFSMGWKVKKVLHSEQSKFQKIEVLDHAVGKLLLLDGKTMAVT